MPEVIRIQRKDFISDLDEIAREGARRMLAVALEAEAADYIERHQERDEHGHAQVVRNGKARPRKLTVGCGTIEVRAPRVDDRRHSEDGRRRTFRSQILPPYMRARPRSPTCCRSSTCVAFPQVTSRRASPRCLAMMHRGSHRPPSRA